MQVKSGVILAGLKLEMRSILITADALWIAHKRSEGVTVTSALNGIHSAKSLHPYGYAVDLRTNYFERDEAIQLSGELLRTLRQINPYYDVIVETDHIHAEYDIIRANERR